MPDQNALNYSAAIASGLHSPVGLSRGFTTKKATGTLDNASAKKRYGPRTNFVKYTVSNYLTPLQGGGHRPMPWLHEFYDILEQAGFDVEQDIVDCHEFFDDREIHVEFKDEVTKAMGESKWLEPVLRKRGSKATILPRLFNDKRQVIRRRVPGLPSCIQAIDVQKAVQDVLPAGCDVLRAARQIHKPFKLSSGKLIEKATFGGVLIDILANDHDALPEVIWLKDEGIYEAFELLREGRQKTPPPSARPLQSSRPLRAGREGGCHCPTVLTSCSPGTSIRTLFLFFHKTRRRCGTLAACWETGHCHRYQNPVDDTFSISIFLLRNLRRR